MAKRIIVDLSRQVLFAYEGMTLVHEFDCVSGDNDNPTTVGRHKVFRKHKIYTSKTYGVPMNYAMFFYKGEALHESQAVGPMSAARTFLRGIGMGASDPFGSHGCIRLSSTNAVTLFNWTPMGTQVDIAREFDKKTRSPRF